MSKIILYDINKKMCNAWKKEFRNYSHIDVKHCSFEELEADYVVTAGNSYGWMTGGIDLAVRNYYGQEIQDIIQAVILEDSGRCLPVGESITVHTKDKKKPNLIYAPTMDLPHSISKIDVFYVFAKLLEKYNDVNFACCGLGTATGGISEEECAKQMRLAFDYYKSIRESKNKESEEK